MGVELTQTGLQMCQRDQRTERSRRRGHKSRLGTVDLSSDFSAPLSKSASLSVSQVPDL